MIYNIVMNNYVLWVGWLQDNSSPFSFFSSISRTKLLIDSSASLVYAILNSLFGYLKYPPIGRGVQKEVKLGKKSMVVFCLKFELLS